MAALSRVCVLGQTFVRFSRCRELQPQKLLLCQLRSRVNISQTPVRCLAAQQKDESLPSKGADEKPRAGDNLGKDETVVPKEEIKPADEKYRERYIPITRRSVIRLLVENESYLTEDEKKVFDEFAAALDTAIVNRYHGVLNELKALFDPINPDKDTIQTRKWSPRERLDNEFWLLKQLEDVMERANFHELSRATVKRAMEEHEVITGVNVRIDSSKYDVLRFWALGKETPTVVLPWYQKVMNLFRRDEYSPKPKEFYKRVVVAIRLKKDQKLLLKAFKEVPVESLEMLLPDGRIRIGKFDKGFIATSVTLASIGLIAKIVTTLAHMNVDWTLIVSLVTGLTAVRGWTMYKNKRNQYLVEISRLLYFKNVANNRGLLALLVDRAEDESFKEALLVYTLLLSKRPPALRDGTSEYMMAEFGGLSDARLEVNIEEWIEEKTGIKIRIDSSEAIGLLKSFGIMTENMGRYRVLPVEAALRLLPQQPQSVVARATESDLSEGYDRDDFLETEEQYKKEEKKTKMFGWF